MLALGIDPGTAICGYGFVESRGSRLVAHEYGAITTSPKAPMQERLLKIYDGLDGLIKKYRTGMERAAAEAALRDEIGMVFSHVLENAGVFKQDEAGQAAFLRFAASVGFKKC